MPKKSVKITKNVEGNRTIHLYVFVFCFAGNGVNFNVTYSPRKWTEFHILPEVSKPL